jgi:hypothetical protein
MPIYFHHRGQGSETGSIRQFEGGSRLLVGRRLENFDGRVSTEILELDVEPRTAKTASGRKCELVGACGYDRDHLRGKQVWSDVLRRKPDLGWLSMTTICIGQRGVATSLYERTKCSA